MKDKIFNNLNFWPIAVIVATVYLVMALIGLKKHHPIYIVNLFYYTDILLNALTGGHPLVTVSARIGKYAYYYRGRSSLTAYMWRSCQFMVNGAFKYLDGEGHCAQAEVWTNRYLYGFDGEHVHIQHGSPLYYIILWPVVFLSSIVLYVLINILGRLLIPEHAKTDNKELDVPHKSMY